MTAKGIAETSRVTDNTGDYPVEMYCFSKGKLQEFIDQLCMEQRELCCNMWPDLDHAIRNAPQPEAL